MFNLFNTNNNFPTKSLKLFELKYIEILKYLQKIVLIINTNDTASFFNILYFTSIFYTDTKEQSINMYKK